MFVGMGMVYRVFFGPSGLKTFEKITYIIEMVSFWLLLWFISNFMSGNAFQDRRPERAEPTRRRPLGSLDISVDCMPLLIHDMGLFHQTIENNAAFYRVTKTPRKTSNSSLNSSCRGSKFGLSYPKLIVYLNKYST